MCGKVHEVIYLRESHIRSRVAIAAGKDFKGDFKDVGQIEIIRRAFVWLYLRALFLISSIGVHTAVSYNG
jgi:hypothetical protein